MPGKAAKVVITERQQVILRQLSRSVTIAFQLRQRAQIILLGFEGRLNSEIEEFLTHCGLWQSPAPRGPPDVDGLVLELDAAYSDSAIDSPDQADESQDLTYVDIDTFLANF